MMAATMKSPAGDGLFPFVLPWDDASPGAANISGWLDRPAGEAGFVETKDGHLFYGGKRIRLFGVNMVFGANFPTHGDADKIAARLAKFGINCVRFHHMDMLAAPDGIWQEDMKTLDPGQLDKMDYFIAKLKEHGIYSNLNLHVSRNYPGMPAWEGGSSFFKGVDLFYPPMLALQRDYARNLLTHKNPYTGNAYADEPAVALIEINNENGLLLEWWGGSLEKMPEVYRNDLAGRWNAWLEKKYPSREALKNAWNAGLEPLGGEMVRDGKFAQGLPSGKPWTLEQHGGAKAVAEKEPGGGIRIGVRQAGAEGWHVQLSQGGLSFEAKRSYTLSFRAKADGPRKLAVSASKAEAPWKTLWSAEFTLTPDWKEYHVVSRGDGGERARIVFGKLGLKTGGLSLADVSLKPGGISGLREGETLGEMPLFPKNDFGARTEAARKDWMTFLWDTEEGYWTDMADFIKKDLKAGSLVMGTATGFSPSPIQARLDVVDSHSYWKHPTFPGKSWDAENWTVGNKPMAGADEGGAFSGMALRRVKGKPFLCTEYNAAAPNTYPGETFLLLSAYAALQDWDGIFAFAWSHRHDKWNTQKISGFFDIDQHPVKMATLPAAAALFVRGDVKPAPEEETVVIGREEGIGRSLSSGPWWDLSTFGISRTAPMRSRTEMILSDSPAGKAVERKAGDPGESVRSGNGELTWDLKGRRVLINTARSKAVIGTGGAGEIPLGEVTVEVKESLQNWAAVSLTVMDGGDFKSAGRFLITASGAAENTEMGWKSPEKNSVGRDWGKAPSLVEGIPVKISLPQPPSKLKAWALDARGQRGKEVPLREKGKGSLLEIGPEYQTLWYEVESRK